MKSSRLWPVVVVLAVAGCQNPWLESPVNNEKYVLSSGWFKPRSVVPEPVYCYRTLAKVDCFDSPRPEYGNRLVNYFGTEEP